MSHQITFNGVYNNWNNALPLGNGKMGAMVFFKDHHLHIALNHYDCYYSILPKYTKKADSPRPKRRTYQAICDIVDRERAESEDISRTTYNQTLHPVQKESRPTYGGSTFPAAGEIVIKLHDALDDFLLQLVIEEGVVLFRAKGSGKEANAKIWVAKMADGLFLEMGQSEPGLWGKAELAVPARIGMNRYDIKQGMHDNTCWLRTSFGEEPFVAETAITTVADCVVASVLPGENTAILHNQTLIERHKQLAGEHRISWENFWRASVHLPDYFVETLWYLHMYVTECASGKGGKYAEQACGLNGLWDIRRPSLWGSMWYWDVNIQEAFWHVFSSNQLELGKHFCDGYLKHQEDIEAYTKDVYGIDGWALDYPHTLYHCIQPWCAQFLWQYYSYSGDLEFLRDSAYPVFQKQIAFFKHISQLGEDEKLHINYDISPEQGPVSHDSVITVSSIKFLLTSAIKAAEMLARPAEEAEEYSRLLTLLPDYTKTDDGTRWKDSALAPDDLFYRHPSILMPIFPAGEISKNSPEDVRNLALNTLKFASENTEIGVFGFGWLAAAAARMGEGTAALRILYEQGLDQLIHSNGMGYEESERFINLCLITKPPIYPPAMVEPSGGIVMAVNAMLLHAGEYIEVFPAVPTKCERSELQLLSSKCLCLPQEGLCPTERNGMKRDSLKTPSAQYKHHADWISNQYPAWDDCAFERLLAPGGFEVSARRRAGELAWVSVTAKRNGILKLKLPAELSPTGMEIIYEKEMAAGEVLEFGGGSLPAEQRLPEQNTILTRSSAFTRRRIFLGEDRHTEFYKSVDSFTGSYLLGNVQRYTMTPYVFDFGEISGGKNYDNVYLKNFCLTGQIPVFYGAPRPWGAEAYDANRGYGFASVNGLCVKDRGAPDDMRRDFVEGTCDNQFWIELARGKYNLLIVSGDETEESHTNIVVPHLGGMLTGNVIKAGRYQCKIVPFMQENDGIFKIGFSTSAGQKWKLNALFLSKEYTL